MRLQKVCAAVVLVAMAAGGHAATVLSQGFDSVAALPASWVQVNNSAAPVGTSYFQGNTGIFTSASGAGDSYIAANFLSTSALTGGVSNWLILPTLTLDSTSTISFAVRAAGSGFLDTIEVRFSSNGSSTNVGATTTSVGDFSSLLGSYSSSTDAGWINQNFSVGLAASTTGRLAIRYVVTDVATQGNYIGIDSMVVTAVPEPASYALLGLGIAGLLLRRRLTA